MKLPARLQPVALWLRSHVTERVALTAAVVVLSVLAWAVIGLDPLAAGVAAILGVVFIVAADFIESELNASLAANPYPDHPPRDAAKDEP